MTGRNLDALAPHDEVKFVIKDRADYEFARDVVAPLRPARRAPRRSCSRRCTACSTRATLSEWMLADRCRCACSCSSTSTSGARDARRLTRWRARRPAERRARFLHRRGDRAARRLRALRADRSATASGTRARSRRRGASRAALGVGAHLELDVDLRGIGGSSLTSDAPVPRDRDLAAAEHPVDLCARAEHDLPVARARLGRSRSARATSSSASTRSTTPAIPTAGPSSSRRSRRSATLATRAGVEGGRFRDPHAAHRADARRRSSGAASRSASTTA